YLRVREDCPARRPCPGPSLTHPSGVRRPEAAACLNGFLIEFHEPQRGEWLNTMVGNMRNERRLVLQAAQAYRPPHPNIDVVSCIVRSKGKPVRRCRPALTKEIRRCGSSWHLLLKWIQGPCHNINQSPSSGGGKSRPLALT